MDRTRHTLFSPSENPITYGTSPEKGKHADQALSPGPSEHLLETRTSAATFLFKMLAQFTVPAPQKSTQGLQSQSISTLAVGTGLIGTLISALSKVKTYISKDMERV